jgi:tRNA-specific 2-thiouridylase
MSRHAVILLSGGLDSLLAVSLMKDQGIRLDALHFTSPFCTCASGKMGCSAWAREIKTRFDIPVHIVSKGSDYLAIVRDPPHGYGRGMNPCIDCRIYGFTKAKQMMAEIGASFVVTGEVVGQRPMSQHRKALGIIERESNLSGLVVRPLSAQILPPTIPEQQGIIDRLRLLSFSGRSRKPQMRLARENAIGDYPCPAGGCLLTDGDFSARLRDLLEHTPDCDMASVHLLKVGRHFRLGPGIKVVLGKNEEENERLIALAPPGTILLVPEDFPGPTALILGTSTPDEEQLSGRLAASYAREPRSTYRLTRLIKGGDRSTVTIQDRAPVELRDGLRIGIR